MMRIIHFLLSLHPKYGGPTASVPVQCRGIAEEGEDVTLVTYTESRPFEEQLLAAGVKIMELDRPKSRLSQMFQIPILQFLRNEDNSDIYHYHGIWMPSNHWISKMARLHKKKAIVNPRGDLETARINYNRWKKIKKTVAWKLYGGKDTQSAACIIATSSQEMKAIRALGITAPVAIIPNGIETSAFPKTLIHKHHDDKIVLFLSRLNPIKGIEYLLDAWKSIPSIEREGWQLHIAGNSDPQEYIKELEERVNELRLNDSVHFLGPITGEDKIQKYQESDLFILPTLNENFGNVIAEAMMCGLPVITTTNAPWSILNDYQCGWWINLSTENLAKAICEAMMLSDDERNRMGERGRQCIEENFASSAVAQKTVDVYKWVLGKIAKPDFIYL